VKPLKVLMSAYACEPGIGSEPGVGWKIAREMARRHEVWVITRVNNGPVIEPELLRDPAPSMRFVYYDLPSWARWWKRGQRGVQLYYYLWQVGVYFVARRLRRQVDFDLTQHVTFVKYWSPSFLALLPLPFVWGPVGGGESAPGALLRGVGVRGRFYETLRNVARLVGEHDPFVGLSARRSRVALATTEETAVRLRKLGARNVKLFSQLGASEGEMERFGDHAANGRATGQGADDAGIRLISIGRLLHWKGFHLGLAAFARADIPGSEYWIVGDGPEEGRLEALARELGVAHRVRFLGDLSREEVFSRLGECDVLVHPSLHDSGGMVCLEAMGIGKPVVCLDLGGPAVQVTEETGFKVPAGMPDETIDGLAGAVATLARDPDLRTRMGLAARSRVREHFSWGEKGRQIDGFYDEALSLSCSPRAVLRARVGHGSVAPKREQGRT
jgi:glycosyltransferase involved in cell wall biosynthesis